MLNVFCAVIVTIATETWGDAFFDYSYIPWEVDGNDTITTIAPI